MARVQQAFLGEGGPAVADGGTRLGACLTLRRASGGQGGGNLPGRACGCRANGVKAVARQSRSGHSRHIHNAGDAALCRNKEQQEGAGQWRSG
jgi:hypothetical protein